MNLLLNEFSISQAFQFESFCPQQVAKKKHIVGGLHAEKYEAHLIFGGFKFTTKYNANSGLSVYNSFNGISKYKAYNM